MNSSSALGVAGRGADVSTSLLSSAHVRVTCPTQYRAQSIIMSFWIYTEKSDICRTFFFFLVSVRILHQRQRGQGGCFLEPPSTPAPVEAWGQLYLSRHAEWKVRGRRREQKDEHRYLQQNFLDVCSLLSLSAGYTWRTLRKGRDLPNCYFWATDSISGNKPCKEWAIRLRVFTPGYLRTEWINPC